jgi:hypothetical protein
MIFSSYVKGYKLMLRRFSILGAEAPVNWGGALTPELKLGAIHYYAMVIKELIP